MWFGLLDRPLVRRRARPSSVITAGPRSALLGDAVLNEIDDRLELIRARSQRMVRDAIQSSDDDGRRAAEEILENVELAWGALSMISCRSCRRPKPMERVELAGFIDELVDDLRAQLPLDGIVLRTVLDAGAVTAPVPRAQLKQMLTELVRNAAESVNEQGVPVETPLIEIHALRAARGCLRIEVHDNGPGVPRRSRDRIFEAFYTTKPNHNGFGLTTCSSIARNLSGAVLVEASHHGGAAFVIELPASEA